MRKNCTSSLKMEGIAVIDRSQNGLVVFSIQEVEYFDAVIANEKGLLNTLFRPYVYVYRKSSELLQQTFKRKGIHENFNDLIVKA